MLRLHQLEMHDSPVNLGVMFGGSWVDHPFRSLLGGVLREMADRLTSLTPLVAITRPYTAIVDGVALSGLPVADGEMIVYVGDDPLPGTLGEAAAGGWSVVGDPLPRSWGGWMDLRPDLDAVTTATVARHELGHVLGARHTDDPQSLMFRYTTPGQSRDITPTDAAELRRAGWSTRLPPTSPSGWQPFPGFTGEVRIVSGDLTGDGMADLIAAAGPGGGPHVKVRDGASGAEVASFYAYDPRFSGGVNVAVGDVNGDGRADIVTGAGSGGGPHVKVFDGRSMSEVQSYFVGDPGSRTGIGVTVVDGHVVTAAGGVIR